MRVLIRRRMGGVEHDSTFHETELLTNSLALGADPSNELQLLAPGAAGQHAALLPDGNGRATLRVVAAHKTLVNGVPSSGCDVAPGDLLVLGASRIEVLSPPSGFDFALAIEEETDPTAPSLERNYAAALIGPRTSARRLAWLGVAVVVIFCLLVPLAVTQFMPKTTRSNPILLTDAVWSTGELHVAHRDAVDGDCGACHVRPFERVQDVSCGACHEKIAEHASQDQLESRALASQRCASCHLEHNEPGSLRSVADAQCSACHATGSFASAHAEFEDYPHIGRTPVIFDHSAHSGKHYADTQKPFQCLSCHKSDGAGQRMATTGFDAMCVDCHGEQDATRRDKVLHHGEQLIKNALLPFFTLPRIDTRQLKKRGVDYGFWPDGTRRGSRTGLTRLGLTPLSELLLAAEPDVGQALTELRSARVKLGSLAKADEHNLENVVIVLNALRQLLGELSVDPVGATANRLEVWLGRELSHRERTAVSGRLSAAEVASAVVGWFGDDPRLSTTTLASYLGAKPIVRANPQANPLPGATSVRLGSWDSEKYSLRYRLSGHADDLLRSWVDLLAEIDHKSSSEEMRAELVRLRQTLLDDTAKPGAAKGIGRCSKCHDLAISIGGELPRWGTTVRTATSQAAAFAHKTHVRDETSCSSCHEASEGGEAEYLNAYTGTTVGGFKPMNKALCAQCHQPDSPAGEACVTCHEYHPGHAGGASWLLLEQPTGRQN